MTLGRICSTINIQDISEQMQGKEQTSV